MKHTPRTIKTIVLFTSALGATLALSGTASADPKTHDGFYLQLDVGLGYLSSSAELPPPFSTTFTYSGITVPTALLLGGTVGPVVIGGGFVTDYAPSPSVEAEGQSAELSDVTLTLLGIGLFADIYPDVHGGLHFQPFIGFGGLEATYQGNSGGSDPVGPIIAVGVGHDWWVGDEWSIGVLGRFAYAPLTLNDVSYSTIAPSIMASFTYH